MSILEKIDSPTDLKQVPRAQLKQLAREIREAIVETVSRNGGHLAASLGTVELAISLHYVFDSPKDKIIWDVGHQAYAHKLLTGRRKNFATLRTYGGISGFPHPAESPHDVFAVGHSSTSISAALGIAVARDFKKQNRKVIAVIGDGGLTGGMAFEALQNAGHIGTDLLVVLNDNAMFISHRVGALGAFLTKLLTAGLVKRLEKKVELFLSRIHFFGAGLIRVAKRFKVLLFPGMLFEELGFSYLGPVDGHDIPRLIEILEKIRFLKGPLLLHVVTKKGRGFGPAEKQPVRFHGVGGFSLENGTVEKSEPGQSYTQVFSQKLSELARQDGRIVAITAAMPEGTGLNLFAREFPHRFFDVGIAEQHALTFAAGLASQGFRPVCAIYSTFLQRAYDQLVQDIALQNLPVVLAIDRAGLVGEDGPTHHGVFDFAFLRIVPNLIVMAPSNEQELQEMLGLAFTLNSPVAIRYPRGLVSQADWPRKTNTVRFGRGELVYEASPDVALTGCILTFGATLDSAVQAAEQLNSQGNNFAVVNLRFLKPLDRELIFALLKRCRWFITVEECVATGGLGSALSEVLEGEKFELTRIALPDRFVEHGAVEVLRDKYGLTPSGIVSRIQCLLRKKQSLSGACPVTP